MASFCYRLWQVIPLLYYIINQVLALLCTYMRTIVRTNATMLQK